MGLILGWGSLQLCQSLVNELFFIHTVEMGCQMVQLLSAHIVGSTVYVNLTLALCLIEMRFT